MLRRLVLLTCAAAVGVTTATTACVQACNDVGCAGGFEWTGRPAGDATLTPGAYVLTVTLEDDSYTIDCQVGATYEDSDCGEPIRVSGEVAWSLELSLAQADPDEWAPTSPVGGFYLRIADTSGSEADGSYSETRGPPQVTIAIRRDDAPLTAVDYMIEYVRDGDYRGDPACGFCDEAEARTHEW
ncbi:hypothetical protein [Nannocystis punicea]|uniref:Lipoprotein n=1 Tax=Nannocystis punicea TaxID=2995304 RepID=A0ABY7H668_9BACT|nr:hypothetical protein [Nannocystis poenicansa]WAS94769.1 hypothetical protein O0S08_01300 [Nannocystis poenicansa]